MRVDSYRHYQLIIGTALIVPLQMISLVFAHHYSITPNDRLLFGLAGSNSSALGLSIIFLAILTSLVVRHRSFWLLLAGTGALSNCLDRVLHGGVVDYVHIGYFPVFNLSDVFIVGGLALFAIEQLRSQKL